MRGLPGDGDDVKEDEESGKLMTRLKPRVNRLSDLDICSIKMLVFI